MNVLQRVVLDKFYAGAAGAADRLPWHRADPGPLLRKAVESTTRRGRALDIGCGSGVFSAYLAQQGCAVTALDLHPAAVAMARRLAESFADRLTVLEADVLSFEAAQPFELILDSGCLHCMSDGALPAYRERILRLLAPGGDFILEHWDKRHALDWRPMGPRRRTPARLLPLFAPELALVEKKTEEMAVPLPLGPTVRGTAYWFKRAA
ncbi:MAG: class I SAM-dependent methyltransferase [Elusimicrobia bacterium]|nr:class I SAM-dependent methyltransferase [Elusimicrobiota bacterium]